MLPVLLALAICLVLMIVFIIGQPEEFKLVRSARMSAPPEKIFPHVNNLRLWDAWSPWAKLDPNAKNSFTGPESGVGASMSWSGNKKIGEGCMTIIASHANQSIGFKLEFVRPFKATNTAEFEFRPAGAETVAVWSMTGKSNFFFKVFGLFMNCDEMAGKDFEKGLASLKVVVEASAN